MREPHHPQVRNQLVSHARRDPPTKCEHPCSYTGWRGDDADGVSLNSGHGAARDPSDVVYTSVYQPITTASYGDTMTVGYAPDATYSLDVHWTAARCPEPARDRFGVTEEALGKMEAS